MNETQTFYDGFADNYQFLFIDWQQTVERQGNILGEFFAKSGEAAPKTVLDCTCGIGTQAIALATQGYKVHGTDLSSESIKQAKKNAAQFETSGALTFDVADLLQKPENPAKYDIVMAYDNPIAHFQTDEQLLTAFQTMAAHTADRGLLTTSLRDYDALSEERPRQSHIRVTDNKDGRTIMFQVWDWHEDGTGYQSEMFVITQDGHNWTTNSYKTTFRAWKRDEVTRILQQAGLYNIKWHMPEESGYYQQIVTARK